jgi:hypothetical protein
VEVERDGNDRDNYVTVNSWTHNRFTEARANMQHVTTLTVKEDGSIFYFTSLGFLIKAFAGWA